MINAAVRNSIRGSGRQAYPHQVARALPRAGLLLYLGRPNLEAADVPIGDDTEIGDDTIIRWMFLLPFDADIRAATGWVSGVGNIFYDAAGDPVAVLASEIAAWSRVNQWNVLFHLVSADTETGRLAVYAVDTPVDILDRAMRVLRAPQPDLPSAFFNGEDFRLATYTGGPTYVPDHLGVLRSPGGNLPAVQGMRLDGVTYVNTDEFGNQITASTPQKTVTYNTDWTAKTFAETFDKFDISDPLKAPGWLCEPVRTNKCTCRKSNPVNTTGLSKLGNASATLTLVTGTELAALTAAGYGNVCTLGNVYRLNNNNGGSGSSFAAVAGVCANVNPHSLSVVYKAALGTCGISFDDAAGIVYGSSTTYGTLKKENVIPSSTTRLLTIAAPLGSDVYFILPQLEEGAFATSPICKASDGSDPLTALTRAATVASFPTAGKIRSNNMAFRMIVVPRAGGQVNVRLFATGTNYASDYVRLGLSATDITFLKLENNINSVTAVAYNHAPDTPIDIIFISSISYGMIVLFRTFSGSWSSFTNGIVISSEGGKANMKIGPTYQLGALNSSAQFTGNISLFDCIPIPSGITDPMAWAKTHWGVA